jgi:hypothetical protein
MKAVRALIVAGERDNFAEMRVDIEKGRGIWY